MLTGHIIGQNIKKYRKEKGITINDLASLIEFSKAFISRVENGLVDDPSSIAIKRIADVLGITVDDLMSTPDSMNRSRETIQSPYDQEVYTEILTVLELMRPLDKNDQLELIEMMKLLVRGKKNNYRPNEK